MCMYMHIDTYNFTMFNCVPRSYQCSSAGVPQLRGPLCMQLLGGQQAAFAGGPGSSCPRFGDLVPVWQNSKKYAKSCFRINFDVLFLQYF